MTQFFSFSVKFKSYPKSTKNDAFEQAKMHLSDNAYAFINAHYVPGDRVEHCSQNKSMFRNEIIILNG